jgi:predicted DNA-binding transcriptional regulator YafY
MTKKPKNSHRVSKVERLLNLVAFLLKQDEPMPWLVIRTQVVGYDEPAEEAADGARGRGGGEAAMVHEPTAAYAVKSAKSSSAGDRRFERDKGILKSLGIPVEYVPRNSIDPGGYYIPRESCFLPRVKLSGEERKILACLHTTAALDGASPVLGALTSALQKLRFDETLLEEEAAVGLPIFRLGAAEQAGVQGNLAALIGAARLRKVVTFHYHSMHRDAVEERAVEPYGVFLRAGKWYVVGRDTVKQAVRMFRLDRILTQAAVNEENTGRPDFQRPKGFRLKKYVGSVTWESGPDPDSKTLYDAEVAFDEEVWWMAREALAGSRYRVKRENGGAVVMMPVHREQPLVRWLLKYGAHAEVVSPKPLRDLMTETARDIRQRHIG